MFAYDTVYAAIKDLQQRGFTVDFNLSENCLVCDTGKYEAEDFEIIEFYRFEGNSDPSDEAIVYGIESKDGIKGLLVNGYGISADPMTTDMIKKLSIHKP